MTTSGSSPVSDSSLRRRSLLLGGVGGAVGLASLGYSTAAFADDPPNTPIFNFDTGNGIDISFQPDARAGQQPSAGAYAPMDLTSAWVNHISAIAWFDTVAPYHPTAVGVYTRIPRRPASESATNRRMNIGIFHSSYQMIKALVPDIAPELARLMVAVGLDPEDESEDPTSPVGIGNLAGKGVLAARARDGINLLGDAGRRYHPRPFADYTGYEPVNTVYDLVDPSRWQPLLTPHRRRLGAGQGDKGVFIGQHFALPQLREVKPYTYRDPSQFRLAPPDHSDHRRRGDYKRSVDEVLAASAGLTDERKVMAELFDNTQLGIGHSAVAKARRHTELGIHGWARLFLAHSTAILDTLIAVWHHKTRYDAVRPVTAIRHVYGHRRVTAWGGPGKGTVSDIPGDEWASYLNTPDHPEYPSAWAAICSAGAQTVRRLFDDDALDWRFTAPAGWTQVEARITPASPVELHFPTWTDLVNACAHSRVWGGVHFKKTVERSIGFGEQFGDRAHQFTQRYVDGHVRD